MEMVFLVKNETLQVYLISANAWTFVIISNKNSYVDKQWKRHRNESFLLFEEATFEI